MTMTLMKAVPLALLASLALTGCATAPKTLYQWGAYQPQVYQHFKGQSPDQQIAVLEKDLQSISAQGSTPPPGFHAHLGMLYALAGRQDQVAGAFETEKKLFPESAAYMDFLLKKSNKNGQ